MRLKQTGFIDDKHKSCYCEFKTHSVYYRNLTISFLVC